jgi:hypothetical protein
MNVHVALVVAGLSLSSAAFAQPAARPSPLSITVEEAVSRALAASHRIDEATARHEATEAVTAGRRAAMLPQVATAVGYTNTNHVETFGILLPNDQLRVIYPDIPNNYRTRLDVQYPISNLTPPATTSTRLAPTCGSKSRDRSGTCSWPTNRLGSWTSRSNGWAHTCAT